MTARLVEREGRQLVELPEGFRLPGTTVRIGRRGRRIWLEPAVVDVDAFWRALSEMPEDFMAGGREQPAMPPARSLDE